MPNWLKSMQQTYRFFKVDPNTWLDIDEIKSIISDKCTINWDSTVNTLGSASITATEVISECYIRIYMQTTQDGITEMIPLGTFLFQPPSTDYDGKSKNIPMTGYTPLMELKEKQPSIGYTIPKGTRYMDLAVRLTSDYTRAPVVGVQASNKLTANFTAGTDDTWLTYLTDLISNADYVYDVDSMGDILFSPKVATEKMQPVATFRDDENSILLPEVTIERDLYGIPNVVEVIYSEGVSKPITAIVKNMNPNSPVSIPNRGREIVHRVINPSLSGTPNAEYIRQYAQALLETLSKLEYKVTYSHGYCPVRVGDCVLLDYERSGLRNIKAKIISQSINCKTGCTIEETAVFVQDLLKG